MSFGAGMGIGVAVGWAGGFGAGIAAGRGIEKKTTARKLEAAIHDKAVSIAAADGRELSGEQLLELLQAEYKKA